MPDGNNLTIDFSDASFDNSSENEQPVPGVDNIDVVFPIDDNPEITVGSGDYAKTGHDFSDNRATSTAPASAIALMPTDAASSAMEEFLFEFDNDLNDDGPGTDQGLKITTSGGSGDQQVVQEINLNGTFENLDTNGSLDVHVSKDPSGNIFEKVTLGEGSDTSGSDNIIFVGGDTNGGDTGAGDDVASINVDASATMGGVFKGGSGYDMIQLVEGVREDNGASVDFTFGLNGPNSAFVSNLGGVGNNMSFDVDEFEFIQLTDNADVIFIGSETGSSLTDAYDAVYLNGGGTNSMMKVQTGFTDGGAADVMYVHADSDVYLSFEFANESGLGVNATFNVDGNVAVDGHIHGSASDVGTDGEIIGVNINQTGGAGSMTIDYFEATNNHDMITNLGDIGIIVNLGGSDGMADVFTGSETSDNDVLDVRNVDDLVFADPSSGYIAINDTVDGTLVNAEVKNVDFIMVSNNVQNANDVDFYQDMTHLNGTKLIDGVGLGATDTYGVGYDVVTSAQVDTFGSGSDMRVYYEGKHSDFIDTDDIVNGTEGIFDMSEGKSDRGSNWESEVDSQYGPGQEPGFFIEVSGKKLAVTFDDEKGEWKVDSSSIQVAEDAMITKNLDGMTEGAFAQSVIDRYGLQPATGSSDGDSSGTENSYPDRAASHDGYYYGSGSGSYGYGSGSYGYGSGSGSYGYGSGSGSYGDGSRSGDNSSNDGFPAVSITGNTADGTISLTVGHNGTYWVLDGSETGDGLAYTNRYYDNIVSLLNDLRNDIGDSYFDELRATSPNPNDFNNEALEYLVPLRWNDYLRYNTPSDGSGSGSSGYGSGSGSYGYGSGSGSYGDGSGSGSYGDGSGSGSYGDGSGSGGDTSGGDKFQEANSPAYSFSDDIYLNATEEAITELLATGVVSDKAFNFSFYTKMDVASGDGMVTVNLKLKDNGSNQFSIDAADIDVAVESFYNVAEDAGAGVTSSSAAGEFVKIDNSADIALGNGGDDTYVVGADSGIYGGVALEYGNIGQYGGLTGSIDAVNINSVDSVEELTFRRGEFRNEEDGNTLFIGDGNGQETVLFDNYNEYLDFRRVEYLTVEDGANNNEIFEIVTNNNLSEWDNEIYVTDGGQTNVELGGLDYVIGSTKADEFVIDLSDLIGEGKSGTVNLSGIDASDTITVNDDGALGNADEAELAATLSAAVTGVASTDGEAIISFSFSNDKLTLNVDTAMDELDIINREFDYLASS